VSGPIGLAKFRAVPKPRIMVDTLGGDPCAKCRRVIAKGERVELSHVRVSPGYRTEPRITHEACAVIKTCPCGARYTAHGWAALRLCVNEAAPRGRMSDGVEVLEYRDCSRCNSTIVIVVSGDASKTREKDDGQG
jgi:hypothetical protein